MNDLLVCTMNYTWPSVDMSLLKRSCERMGVQLRTWGDDRTWPGYGPGKIEHARDFLRSRPEEMVLYTDSQDSLLVQGADAILAGWENAGAPQILLQAETNCYPERDWGSEYPVPESGSPWRYICAGGWMGRRETLVRAFDEIMLRDLWRTGANGCDQRCWTDWYLQSPGAQGLASLDTQCEVFQSMAGPQALNTLGENTVTKSHPSVLHFNGRTPGREDWYTCLCTI